MCNMYCNTHSLTHTHTSTVQTGLTGATHIAWSAILHTAG